MNLNSHCLFIEKNGDILLVELEPDMRRADTVHVPKPSRLLDLTLDGPPDATGPDVTVYERNAVGLKFRDYDRMLVVFMEV